MKNVPRRTLPRALAAAIALTMLATLAACSSSPPSRFYTLSAATDAGAGTAQRTTAPAANPALLIEVAPVDMPSQVARNQLVVQKDANEVSVLEEQRWASLPGDEVRRALSGDLAQRLGTIDVYGAPYPEGVPVYRVSVNVHRFESWPGSHALIDAVWSVRPVGSRAVMTCRSVASVPVASGYDALVDGHRRAVQAIAAAIAGGVQSLAALPRAADMGTGTGTGATASAGAGKSASRATAARTASAAGTSAASAAPLVPCPATAMSPVAASVGSSAAVGSGS
ncbi:PqiC family protein [Paraburkholderia kururiensis]